jgi:hypothetical protein
MQQTCGIVAVAGVALFGWMAAPPTPKADACGGFFCQQVPINQAGEQIIFRQIGDRVVALVLIQYSGEAQDFSWVVPVPGVPTLSTGSGALFQSLELATRPQFNLQFEGEPCFDDFAVLSDSLGGGDGVPESAQDDGVEVLDSGVVGPFVSEVVSSDDPDALARWLDENNYELSGDGAALLAPYIDEGMNFVALRLQKDQGVGDIRPLIMEYESTKPVIPIRLTAVAADDDMGVLTWILGEGRAIPLNYLHVVPNYTLLNWYQGSTSAYVSYQGLITTAMNEAGGQGFATDYAAALGDLLSQLPDPVEYRTFVESLADTGTAQAYYEALIFNTVLTSNTQLLEILRRELPLPEGVEEFVYNDPSLLIAAVGEDAALSARARINRDLITDVVDPLDASIAVFEDVPYISRLYTTLSAHEMTLDPSFSINPKLEDQSMVREAKLTQACGLSGTTWSLELGTGTDRPGEVVLEGTGSAPFVAPVIDQPSVVRAEFFNETSTTGDVQIDNSAALSIVQIDNGTGGGTSTCGAGVCGGGAVAMSVVGVFGLWTMGLRRRR